MLDIATQLLEGQGIRLGPIEYEKDPEIESKWTHNAEFMRLLNAGTVHGHSAAQPIKD